MYSSERIWGITREKVDEAVRRLVETASPAKIILFGSYAGGTATDDSDVDILVIERTVSNRYTELVRLNKALHGLMLAVDLLVVGADEYDGLRHIPGSVYRKADSEGMVVYDAA